MRAKIITMTIAFLLAASVIFYPVPEAEAQDTGLTISNILEFCLSLPGVIEGCVNMCIPIMAALVQGVGMLFAALFAVAPDFFEGFAVGALVVLIPGYFCLSLIPTPVVCCISWINMILAMLGIISPFLVIDCNLYAELILGCVPATLLGILSGIIQWTSTSPAESMGIDTERLLREGQDIINIIQTPPPASENTTQEGEVIQPRHQAGG